MLRDVHVWQVAIENLSDKAPFEVICTLLLTSLSNDVPAALTCHYAAWS